MTLLSSGAFTPEGVDPKGLDQFFGHVPLLTLKIKAIIDFFECCGGTGTSIKYTGNFATPGMEKQSI